MLIEGEGQTNEIVQGANTEASPTPAETQETQTSPASGANAGAEPVPFHKQPGASEYIERQKKNWERDYKARFDSEMSRFREESDRRYKMLEQKLNSGNSQLNPENLQNLRALSQLLSQDAEARKALGLDEINELREKVRSYEEGNKMSGFNSELESVAKKYADDFGFDAKDVEADLLDYIQNDPFWSSFEFKKGLMGRVAKDYFSDKTRELEERRANMKLVQEQKNKAKVSTQRPSGGTQNTEQAPPKSMKEALDRAFKKSKEVSI